MKARTAVKQQHQADGSTVWGNRRRCWGVEAIGRVAGATDVAAPTAPLIMAGTAAPFQPQWLDARREGEAGGGVMIGLAGR